MNLVGHQITKNTVVGMSLGTITVIIVFVWTALGIGRPLFASDLERIENKIDGYQHSTEEKIDWYQTSTAIQILSIRRAALQAELREVKRDVRRNPDDGDAMDDADEITDEIKELDVRIACYRTEGCEVGDSI